MKYDEYLLNITNYFSNSQKNVSTNFAFFKVVDNFIHIFSAAKYTVREIMHNLNTSYPL